MNEQVKAEIVKIVINIGDKTFEITGEQALRLRDELNKLFPENGIPVPTPPVVYPTVPYDPYPSPWPNTTPWNPNNPGQQPIFWCISIT